MRTRLDAIGVACNINNMKTITPTTRAMNFCEVLDLRGDAALELVTEMQKEIPRAKLTYIGDRMSGLCRALDHEARYGRTESSRKVVASWARGMSK